MDLLVCLSLASYSMCVCVCYNVQRSNGKDRCVIGNNRLYQVKSICHCEEGGEGEEK